MERSMKTKILTALREAEDYVSGQQLCEQFGVSRTAVWKVMNQLKEAGYQIKSVQNKGYKLLEAPDILSEDELKSLRKTEWAGKDTFYFPVIDSTNSKAKQLAEQGYPHGTLVVADKQEAGRGRRGRSWSSPAGINVYMTLLLKPEIEIAHASMLTLVAALAVSKALEKQTGIKTAIKWPNDIVLNGKKVCGILTELSVQIDYIDYIVIGIGINVHNENFPEEIASTATSLCLETGKHYSRAAVIEDVLEYFEKYYEIYLRTQDLSELVEIYNEELVNRGKGVRILDPKEPFEGVALGINDKGELLVETEGEVRKVVSGEVSVRGIYGYV